MNRNKVIRGLLQGTGIISFAVGFGLMVTSLQFNLPPICVLSVAPLLGYGVAAPIFAILYNDSSNGVH